MAGRPDTPVKVARDAFCYVDKSSCPSVGKQTAALPRYIAQREPLPHDGRSRLFC